MNHLSHLNKYFVRYKWRLLLGVLFIIASNIFGVMMPKVIGSSIDHIQEKIGLLRSGLEDAAGRESIVDDLVFYGMSAAGLYMLFSLLKGLFLFFTRQTIIVTSRFIEYDLKNEVFAHYQQLDQAFYKRNNTGDLMNRISEDVSQVRMYLGPAVMYTINLAVLFVLVISSMVETNVELTLLVLAPLPIMSVIIYYVSKIINKKSELVQQQQSWLSTFVQETFSGIRVLKAFQREKEFSKEFDNASEEYLNRNMSLVRTNAFFMPTIVMLIGLSTIITIWVGGLKAMNGEITNGNIAEFVIYVNMLTWPFASVGWVTSLVQRAAASQKRINEFLRTEPVIVNGREEPDALEGRIEFENVSFTYPDSGIEALQDVSFRVDPGETLAIIGHTGSGKSTIANLLCRLYDPTQGTIRFDDKDLREMNLSDMRDSIGYVPQEVFLFSDSIANNISFGMKRTATQEEIEKAAKDADVYHNIVDFPEGFETRLGERGINLSGGQKQRISIARAIIKDPNLLIFDDCLSAVDTETEEKILNALKRIMKGKTAVIISHRVSAVKNADKILVLENGTVAEQGTHDVLLTLNGIYKDIYEKQLLEEQKVRT